jgi:acetolactate synthase small subunit
MAGVLEELQPTLDQMKTYLGEDEDEISHERPGEPEVIVLNNPGPHFASSEVNGGTVLLNEEEQRELGRQVDTLRDKLDMLREEAEELVRTEGSRTRLDLKVKAINRYAQELLLVIEMWRHGVADEEDEDLKAIWSGEAAKVQAVITQVETYLEQRQGDRSSVVTIETSKPASSEGAAAREALRRKIKESVAAKAAMEDSSQGSIKDIVSRREQDRRAAANLVKQQIEKDAQFAHQLSEEQQKTVELEQAAKLQRAKVTRMKKSGPCSVGNLEDFNEDPTGDRLPVMVPNMTNLDKAQSFVNANPVVKKRVEGDEIGLKE